MTKSPETSDVFVVVGPGWTYGSLPLNSVSFRGSPTEAMFPGVLAHSVPSNVVLTERKVGGIVVFKCDAYPPGAKSLAGR